MKFNIHLFSTDLKRDTCKEPWITVFSYIAGLGVVPCVIQIFTMPFCPESPRFLLLTKNRERQARKGDLQSRHIFLCFCFTRQFSGSTLTTVTCLSTGQPLTDLISIAFSMLASFSDM